MAAIRTRAGTQNQGPRRRCTQVVAFKTDAALVNASDHNNVPVPKSSTVRYRFIVPQYVTAFGQSLRVVGSLPELGDWTPQLAPLMSWSEGHQWSLECMLPQRSFEFKIIVFEGNGVRWEGGSNRVVSADDDDGDIPVEIVVWLTCTFDATDSTQLQLAVPRASIQDAYETGKATLEFLKRRKSKLGHDTEQDPSPETRRRQAQELARLSEALVEQSTTVQQLSGMLGQGAPNGKIRAKKGGEGAASLAARTSATMTEDEDQLLLLLAIDSVKVPRVLRRISFVQTWAAAPAVLSSGTNGNGNSGADGPSPFLRGELDSRAEELMSAAEEMLQELKSSNDGPVDGASVSASEWASLAAEAGYVAVALAALEANGPAAAEAAGAAAAVTQMQMRGLASMGNALASTTGSEAPDGGELGDAVQAPGRGEGVLASVVTGQIVEVLAAPVVEVEVQPEGVQPQQALATITLAESADGVDVGTPRSAKEAEASRRTASAAAVSGIKQPALEGPGHRVPGAHPLQRLAATVKDLVRPAASAGPYTGAEHSLEAAPEKAAATPEPQDQLIPAHAWQATGLDGHPSPQPPGLQEPAAPMAATAKPRLSIPAFVDSLHSFLDSFFL